MAKGTTKPARRESAEGHNRTLDLSKSSLRDVNETLQQATAGTEERLRRDTRRPAPRIRC